MKSFGIETLPARRTDARADPSVRRPTYVLRPSRGWSAVDLPELWEYRDVLRVLALRDVKLRYRQTALGVVWVVLQPLAAALIFTVFFGRLAHLPAEGAPYLLFAFCGLIPWTLFSQILQRSGASLVGDARLIQKVYFPRLIIPAAALGACLVDFVLTLAVLAILMLVYRREVGSSILLLPFFSILTVAGATGAGLWLAAFNVRYRDFMYALPFIIQIWLFASPVAYAGNLVPTIWRPLYSLNPAVGYVEGFRWSVLGHSTLTWSTTLVTSAVSVLLLVTGALVFRRVERTFADVV